MTGIEHGHIEHGLCERCRRWVAFFRAMHCVRCHLEKFGGSAQRRTPGCATKNKRADDGIEADISAAERMRRIGIYRGQVAQTGVIDYGAAGEPDLS